MSARKKGRKKEALIVLSCVFCLSIGCALVCILYMGWPSS